MTPSPELRDLCSAAVENRLTPADSQRLEALVLADPAARAFVTQFLHLHASLAWSATDPSHVAEPAAQPARSRSWLKWAGWSVAAALLVAISWQALAPAKPSGFAAIREVKSGKWEGGSLPTAEGARLDAGRLKLAEGLACIVFDNGAEIRIEGPADIELLAVDQCVLHSGRLVAKMPESAHGFRVRTPTADLLDLGTEFGVSVRDGQTSDVQVFAGRVDVTHLGSGKVESMLTGRGLRFRPDGVTDFDPTAENPAAPAAKEPAEGERIVTLTTETGNGKDAYIEAVMHPKPGHRSDVLMLIKSAVAVKGTPYNRKGYLGMDLALLAGSEIKEAELSFTMVPTGLGFAAEVGDSTFSVYGLTDESQDFWDEKGLTWPTAPGNDTNGPGLDMSRVEKLGEFRVPQGVQSGVYSIAGAKLVEFLKQDTNGLATFVLVRDTLGSGRNDLVHGFANKRHPTLPPPTLKLVVK